jgi:hypothetical protein
MGRFQRVAERFQIAIRRCLSVRCASREGYVEIVNRMFVR